MLDLIQNQLMLYLAILLVMFLPGYCLLLAFWGKDRMSLIERTTVSLGTSILVTDFLMLLMDRVGILFSRASLVTALLLFSAVCYLVYRKRFPKDPAPAPTSGLSQRQTVFMISILFLATFLRVAYLQTTLPSSSTDLGHHMYWAKLFAQTGQIENYTQSDIVEKNEVFRIDAPKPISDFIIGEHLIFSATSLISGADFISAFPVSLLLIIDIFSLLALFILALRMFGPDQKGHRVAILALFFASILFTIDPPQAKFVGGGVIGNVIGNLLIPLTFYFYLRFLEEKGAPLLFFALFFSMGLFYTHHLSGFIFLLAFAIFIISAFVLNFKASIALLLEQKKLLRSPLLWSFVAFAALFVLVIYTPTYLTNKAVGTVVGAIKKAEHTGLSLAQFRDTLGEARLAVGLLGLLFLIPLYRKNASRYAALLLASWVLIIGLISLVPDLIKIDIPSGRVANYGVYPFSLLAAAAFVPIFERRKSSSLWGQRLLFSAFTITAVFLFVSSSEGLGSYFKNNNSARRTVPTLEASRYLAGKLGPEDLLAADHIDLAADSWIKLFFMRDYYFPSYRANLDRYENGVDKHEFCTRDMISDPGGKLGSKCYSDLGTDFVMVDKALDSAQFQKLDNFSQIYSNDQVNVYYREK